jgi:hypothetical protein
MVATRHPYYWTAFVPIGCLDTSPSKAALMELPEVPCGRR